jgi:hypothetical protein
MNLVAPLAGVELTDGVIELDLAVERERAFHGVFWRARDDENYESFFVRPHQVGNPDGVQYTPVFHGVSGWQLYTGRGFWAPVAFPIGGWFTIRVVFRAHRAEVFVVDGSHPALVIGELKAPITPGGIGLQIGGPGLTVARFAYSPDPPAFRGRAPRRPAGLPGLIPAWLVSDPVPEASVPSQRLTAAALRRRHWTPLAAEPGGLANLARVAGIRGPADTVYARTALRSNRTRTVALDLGFSDRARVFLNGHPLYHGDDTYRSRDYRFLGSIGWYDTLHLPLRRGRNELVVAVSETFGGWGLQARLHDREGIAFD